MLKPVVDHACNGDKVGHEKTDGAQRHECLEGGRRGDVEACEAHDYEDGEPDGADRDVVSSVDLYHNLSC